MTRLEYCRVLHAAVRRSEGLDYYTGEVLDWSLIATLSPKPTGRKDMVRCGGRPSVDHYAGPGYPDYKLCRADTNHAKAYLGHGSFVALCRKVVAHADRQEAERAAKRAGGGGPGET